MKRLWKKHWKKLVFVLVLAGIGTAAWFYSIKPLVAKLKGQVVDPKDIVTVKKDKVEVLFTGSGTVTAKQDIKVTSKPSGILKAVYVKEGDYVRKGQEVGGLSRALPQRLPHRPRQDQEHRAGHEARRGKGDHPQVLGSRRHARLCREFRHPEEILREKIRIRYERKKARLTCCAFLLFLI